MRRRTKQFELENILLLATATVNELHPPSSGFLTHGVQIILKRWLVCTLVLDLSSILPPFSPKMCQYGYIPGMQGATMMVKAE